MNSNTTDRRGTRTTRNKPVDFVTLFGTASFSLNFNTTKLCVVA